MKFTAAAALSLVSAVAALPSSPLYRRADSNVTDTDILNYALTLEHLENKFYSDALAKFDNNAFIKAGLPSWARGRFQQIAAHEATHVATLAGALGDKATQPCEYSFPYTDPASFAALSGVIEGVGVSAYLGAAALIKEPAYLTVAGSILTTESRHQAWIMSAIAKAQPWSGANDTPLTLSQVYTIAAGFIKKCPPGNPALPVKAFPALTATNATPGNSITYTFTSKDNTKYYAYIYSGLGVAKVDLTNKKGKLPTTVGGATLQGTYYTIISTASDSTAVSGDNTVAGPLISVVNFWSK